MAQEFQRVMTCEPPLPNADPIFLKVLCCYHYHYHYHYADPIFLKEMIDVVPFHLLARSEKYGKSSACGNQFTIGWMCHLRKPLNYTSSS